MKISDTVNAYIQFRMAANARESTLKEYSCLLGHLLSFCRQHNYTDSDQITGQLLQQYVIHRQSKCLADTTIATEHRVICAFARWCIANKHTGPIDFRATCPRPKVDEKTPRWLTDEEYAKLRQAARVICRRYALSKSRDYAAILMLVDTGLRKSELLRLKVGDVNWKLQSVRVSASAKGRKERTVYFGSKCKKALRVYLEERGYSWVEGSPQGDLNEPLWIARTGNTLNGARLWSIVREVAKLAGLDGVKVHSLRHTCCSMLLSRNMPVSETQALMGHARVATTMIYTHTNDDKIRRHYKDACPSDDEPRPYM